MRLGWIARVFMNAELKQAWDYEWQYRYDERLAIMCEDREPTEDQKEIARKQADKELKALKQVAKKRRLTDRWCEEWKKAKGDSYIFRGPIDGAAADRLLKTDLPVEELIGLAVQAWKHPDWFHCKQAVTLSSFGVAINGIREELKNPPLQNGARLMLFRDEYNRILARMQTLRQTYSGMQSWPELDKAEFIRLRTRRDELRKILGMVV